MEDVKWIDFDLMVDYVIEKTGLSKETVVTVLDCETDYLKEAGVIEEPEVSL